MTSTDTVTELTDETTGVWRVLTETSEYVLDLDERTARRVPGNGAGLIEGLPHVEAVPLRKDGDTWALHAIVVCEIGEPMVLFGSGIADDAEVSTYRRTTYVRSIERIKE